MTRTFLALASLLSGLSAAVPAAAQTTSFKMRQIIIAGDDNVEATAINDKGTIVASLFAGITDTASAVTINGSTVTTLPLPEPDYGALNPRAINESGAILGWARGPVEGLTQTFLFQGGTYNTAYQNPVIEPGPNAQYIQPDPMGLTKSNEIFFNTIYSLSGPIGTNYGKPPKYRTVPSMGRFTVIQSINDAGTIAGTAFSFSGVHLMFAGAGKKFVTIAPPGSINTLGGYLNRSGAIAGSYEDASHVYHGFIYQGGAYTSFDMPEAATTIAATAINSSGHIAGSYTAASDRKVHGFLYNGTTVSSFGTYEPTDNVSVALNDKGAMVLLRQIASAKPKYESYRVTCVGAGC